ncbi:MAG: Lrp/AsnC family transcriptional regulator [Microbacterium sp.]|nr:Lrp/AsnC family transcriptional regulator [Microbacterium sp.]
MSHPESPGAKPSAPKDLRSPELDGIDAELVRLLSRDGRTTNAELAAAVDQTAIGRGLQAMVGVTLRPGSRQESISEFADEVRRLPQVVQLFFVGGADDFLIHIAVPGSSELREFVVEHLSAQRSVASTRTSVIFDYHRNVVAASFD